MERGKGDRAAVLHVYLAQALALDAGRCTAKEYNHLLQSVRAMKHQLRLQGPSHDGAHQQLALLIDALTKFVSKLDHMLHKSLLTEVFSLNVWCVSKELRRVILELVVHLVVAKGVLVVDCHKFLCGNLQPPPQPPVLDQASPRWEMQPDQMAIQDEVINTLVKVHRLIPTLPPMLIGELQGRVPHKLRDVPSHCIFFRALFELSRKTTAPTIRDGILGITVCHLLSMDVEIRWEHICSLPEEEEQDEKELVEEDVFSLEEQAEHLHLGTESLREPNTGGRGSHRDGFEGTHTRHPSQNAACGDPGPSRAADVDKLDVEMVEKLDRMMEGAMRHLHQRLADGQGRDAWLSLLLAFRQSILPTFRVKFTQYLIWYMCAKGPPSFTSDFVDTLLGGLRDPRATLSLRSACAAYLASFLARAAFVPVPLLLSSLESLASFCTQYLQAQGRGGEDSEGGQAAEAGQQHQVLYAASQALLYVLCFRMEALVRQPSPPALQQQASSLGKPALAAAPEGAALRQLLRTTLPPLLRHKLAPLASCNPCVTAEFAQLAARLGFQEAAPLLPGAGQQANHKQRPLELFFPFDPYLLPSSAHLLDLPQTYICWHAGHPRPLRQPAPSCALDADLGSDASSDDEIRHPEDSGSHAASDSSADSSGVDSDSDEEDSGGHAVLAQVGAWHRPVALGRTPGKKRNRPPSLLGTTPLSEHAFPAGSWREGLHSLGSSPNCADVDPHPVPQRRPASRIS